MVSERPHLYMAPSFCLGFLCGRVGRRDPGLGEGGKGFEGEDDGSGFGHSEFKVSVDQQNSHAPSTFPFITVEARHLCAPPS